ncbi:MAG: acetate/propionate family kinase [Nitrospirales bacterium]|nr:acetate/propionate family kinase [Nitrospirales bacterium]
MRILILNSGSSSLKCRLIDYPSATSWKDVDPTTVLQGIVTGIGKEASLKISVSQHQPSTSIRHDILNHGQAVTWVWESLRDFLKQDVKDQGGRGIAIDAVGVRVVHGGHRFTQSVVIDNTVLDQIEELSPLAPLHNPPCLEGIYQTRALLGSRIPIVAVFDTAFHHTLPAYAYTYAIPGQWTSRHGIRRFGFHGIAHASLAESYARYTGRPLNELRLITFQLGQGCSVTAIKYGQVVETSMGFSPLEGLVMGTRSGDLDPAILHYIAGKDHLSLDDLYDQLNTQSGLLGLSGHSFDMKVLLQAAHENPDSPAALAIRVFTHRARKYLGAYLAILGGADAVVFGGGIGEHAPDIRAGICQGMEWCGLKLNSKANLQAPSPKPSSVIPLHEETSALEISIAGTDEEAWIGRETLSHLCNT